MTCYREMAQYPLPVFTSMVANLHCILATLSRLWRFGEIVGNIDCEFVTVEKFKILTGVRRVLMVLKKGVPCKLRIQKRSYRTHHRDQIQTCFRCGVSGHQARDCPARPNAARTRTHHTSYSTAVQGQAADRTEDDNQDAHVHVQEPTEPNPRAAIAGWEKTTSPEIGLSDDTQQQQVASTDISAGTADAHSITGSATPLSEARQAPDQGQQADLQQPRLPLTKQQQEQQQPEQKQGSRIPSQTTPVIPTSRLASWGKATHASPDEEGFTLGSGKHTFNPRVLPASSIPSRQPQQST